MYIEKCIFCASLFYCLFVLSCSESCSPEYCNFAGECKISGKKPSCSCYAEAFEGKYCERVKNLCKSKMNICKPQQVCVPYVGQVMCECPANISRTACQLPKALVSYNVRVPYGAEEAVVISFAEFTAAPKRITISTPTHLIGHVLSLSPDRRRHTANLTATLRELGIRTQTKLPYNVANYYVFKARHYTLGANRMNVTVTTERKQRMDGGDLLNLSLVVHVARKAFDVCLGTIVFQQGMEVSSPRKINIEHFTVLQAILEKQCKSSKITSMQVEWWLFNSLHQQSFLSSQLGNSLVLKIPRYKLWYESLLEFYPDLLITAQVAVKQDGLPLVSARCYLNITARNVIAYISGGQYREVSANSKWLKLDGSRSREPAHSPSSAQNLRYTWELSSGTQRMALAVGSSNPWFNLQTAVLSPTEPNVITLTVYNKFVPARVNSVEQVIVLKEREVKIRPIIVCVRNCKGNVYSASSLLHLRAQCATCKESTKYTWYLNSDIADQNKRRLVKQLPPEIQGELLVKLVAADSTAGEGIAELRLHEAEPPTGGHCSVEPPNGIECTTKFNINCQDFQSNQQLPISYVFKIGNFYQSISHSGKVFLYLNRNNTLIVNICVNDLSCTTIDIPVEIEPFEFSEDKDMHALLRYGRRQEAYCIFQVLSGHPGRLNVFRDPKILVREFSYTLIEMLNTIELASHCIHTLGSFQRLASNIIIHLLKRALTTFDFIVEDTEALDMTEQACLGIGKTLTNMISYCQNPNYNQSKFISIVEDAESVRDEIQFSWLNLDHENVLRHNYIMSTTVEIFKLWHKTGQELTRYINPEEPFSYLVTNITYSLQSHEIDEPIDFQTDDTCCAIKVPLRTMKELQKMFGKTGDLLLQVWCFNAPIFWWVPVRSVHNTAIIAVNIFCRNAPTKLTTVPNDSIQYHIRLRLLSNTTKRFYEDSNVIHNNIVIYRFLVSRHVNLIAHFHKSDGITVTFTMDVKPSFNSIQNRSCFIPKGCQSRSIILKNHCMRTRTAFLAVYKADTHYQKPVRYSVRITAQKFNTFNLDAKSPLWKNSECNPNNDQQYPQHTEIDVNYLSVFAGKEVAIKPLPHQYIPSKLKTPPLNYMAILFFCLLSLFAVFLLLFANLRYRLRNNNLTRVIRYKSDEEDPSSENVILHIQTGGRLFSKTTANVKLLFISDLGRYKVVIYQNPLRPCLNLNTSCLMRLSDRRVQLPCRLTISQDGTGRYPSWYCRIIQVDDLRRDLSYKFEIRRWIRHRDKITVSCLPGETSADTTQLHDIKPISKFSQKWKMFRVYCKCYFTNWFMLQPVLGPWRVTDYTLNAFERTCYWICKTFITLCIVICYYRNTTAYNAMRFRHLTFLTTSELMAVTLGSYAAVLVFHFCLDQITPLGIF